MRTSEVSAIRRTRSGGRACCIAGSCICGAANQPSASFSTFEIGIGSPSTVAATLPLPPPQAAAVMNRARPRRGILRAIFMTPLSSRREPGHLDEEVGGFEDGDGADQHRSEHHHAREEDELET